MRQNNTNARGFDLRTGKVVDDTVAFKRDGTLKDGFGYRVPLMMCDGASVHSVNTLLADGVKGADVDLAAVFASAAQSIKDTERVMRTPVARVDRQADRTSDNKGVTITDGTDNPLGLHRPGFRYAVDGSWPTRREPTPEAIRGADAASSFRDGRSTGRLVTGDPSKPGYRMMADRSSNRPDAVAMRAADVECELAYAEVAERDANAWRRRGDAEQSAMSFTTPEGAEGSACTLATGERGVMVRKGDRLECVPLGSRDAFAARDAAYEQRDKEDQERWRGNRQR